jgi:lactate permease
MVGRQTPILAVFVPLVLVLLVDGRRGLRETWGVALAAGLSFGIAQFLTSNYLSLPLTDIIAALVSVAVVVAFVRLRPPPCSMPTGGPAETATVPGRGPDADGDGDLAPVGGGTAERGTGPGGVDTVADTSQDSRRDTVLAYLPYVIIIALFSLQQIPAVDDALGSTTTKFGWPGLHVVTAAGKPVSTTTFTLNWLEAAGTILLLAGVLTAIALRVRPRDALSAYGRTLVQLRTAIVTVMAVLALAYVMNLSGQTLTLGKLLAGTGGFFAVLSPVLGWLGTAVTGSDTSANSLFGALQVTAAQGAGLDPVLLAAANSSGGVLGKMISPQNLAIAAAAVGMGGREGEILRRVLLWSLVFLAGMCLLVYLQSTPVLGWMVVPL